MESKLNDKQKKFCEEWLFEYNATKAYRAAYPDCKTDNSAAVNASKLLRNAKIKDYIEELKENIGELAGLSKLGVLEELKKVILEENKESVATRDKLKALEVVNKMLGYNAAEKQDITTKNSILTVKLTKTDTPPITNESQLFDDD
jgi:phage terminase small subunit